MHRSAPLLLLALLALAATAQLLQSGRRFPLGVQLGGEVENCTEETNGLLRFLDNEVQVCKNGDWEPVSSTDVNALNERVTDLESALENSTGPGCCPATNLRLQNLLDGQDTLIRMKSYELCRGRGIFDADSYTCSCFCNLNTGCYDDSTACETCGNGYTGERCRECAAGFETDGGNPATCVDIDECLTDNGGCHAEAECINTVGSRECRCLSPYSGSGEECVAGFHGSFSYISPTSTSPFTLYGSAWTTLPFNTELHSYAVGLDHRSGEVRVEYPGTYMWSVQWRRGAAQAQDWLAARVYSPTTGETLGTSTASQTLGTYDPTAALLTVTVEIVNTSLPYVVQIGRSSYDLSVSCCPSPISSHALPALSLSVSLLPSAHALLLAPPQTFAAHSWTSLSFSGSEISAGVEFGGVDSRSLRFAEIGAYMFHVEFGDVGGSGDMWTAMRVVRRLEGGGVEIVGETAWGAHLTGDTRGQSWILLANISTSLSYEYELQMGRHNGAMTVYDADVAVSLSPWQAKTLPAMQVHIYRAHAGSLDIGAVKQDFAGSGAWTPISWSESLAGSGGIQYAGPDLTFERPGVYAVSMSHRAGNADDTWMGVRLRCGQVVAGNSAAVAFRASTDSYNTQYRFLAHIPASAPLTCRLEYGRAGGSLALTPHTPLAIDGYLGQPLRAQIVEISADVDECAEGVHTCDTEVSECTDTVGLYECTRTDCSSGLEGVAEGDTPLTCSDPLECLDPSHPSGCHPFADCTNDPAGRSNGCECRGELEGEGENGADCGEAVAQVEVKARDSLLGWRVLGGEWNTVPFDVVRESKDISLSGSLLRFRFPGRYAFSISFRFGSGAADWIVARLAGSSDSATYGLSTGSRHIDSNDPSLCTLHLHATITNTSQAYAVQLGRSSRDLVLATNVWDLGGGAIPPFISASIHRMVGDSAALVAFGAQTIGAASIWDAIAFDRADHAVGITVGADPTAVYFSRPGTYRFAVSFRGPAAADRWTAVRLWDVEASAVRGVSHAGANPGGNAPQVVIYYLVADVGIAGVGRAYQVQIGRHTTTSSRYAVAVDDVPYILGEPEIPDILATVEELAGPAASIYTTSQVIGSGSWPAVSLSSIPVSSTGDDWALPSSTTLRIPTAGVYAVTIGYRNGNGGDVWTAYRLECDGQVVGTSAASGRFGGEHPQSVSLEFVASVVNDNAICSVHVGRYTGAGISLSSPGSIDGVTGAAFGITLVRIHRAIDECALGIDACDTGAGDVCVDHVDGYECQNAAACPTGYERRGWSDASACVDVDECAATVSPCHALADCTNTEGSFACACRSGLIGDGVSACNASVLGQLDLVHGSHYTLSGGAWTDVVYTAASFTHNVALVGATPTANIAISAPADSVVAVSVGHRTGTGNNDWLAYRLFDQSTVQTAGVGAGDQTPHTSFPTKSFFTAVVNASSSEFRVQAGRPTHGLEVYCCPMTIFGGYPSISTVVRTLPSAYAEFHADAHTAAANTWTGVSFAAVERQAGIELSSANFRDIRFDHGGRYLVSVSFRTTSGGDIWTGVRLRDVTGSEVRGVGNGGANKGNDMRLMNYLFIADIPDSELDRVYQVEIGRHNGAQTTGVAPAILGQAIPSLTTTISEISGAFMQAGASAQTFPGSTWDAIDFNVVASADGIALDTAVNVKFDFPGVYHITLGFRSGAGGDVWTGPRLLCGSTVAGRSAPSGQVGTQDSAQYAYDFLAEVTDVNQTCQLQIGRHAASNMSPDNPSVIDGQSMSSIVATFIHVSGA